MTCTAEKLKPQRYGSCDLLRFIFSLYIVGNHFYHIGVPGEPFVAARIFVEFFFMVSGYFMIQHFEKNYTAMGTDVSAKNAFGYTLRKYKSLMYFVIPCILAEYLFRVLYNVLSSDGFSKTGDVLQNLPLELSMIGPLTDTRSLVPIWYISAMLIAMPLLCFVYLRFRTAFIYIFSWLVPVVYLLWQNGVHPKSVGVEAVARGYCDMSLGCFVYFFAQKIKSIDITRFRKLLLTLIEFICFALPIYYVSFKNESQYNLILLLFGIGIAIMMSRCSYSAKINGRFFSYLGKLSLPIYTLHWCIGSLVLILIRYIEPVAKSLEIRIAVYYALTIISAIILCFAVDKIKARQKSKKQKA